MAGRVVSDNVYISGVLVEAGTREADVPAELVGRVGEHLWELEGDQASVSSAGEALVGLRENVWIGGKCYDKGTVPPADIIPLVGAHMWVAGFSPVVEEVAASPAGGAPLPPTPEPVENDVVTDDDPETEPAGPATPEVGGGEVTDPVDAPKPPPLSGKGSSEKAWREYALSVGVHVDEANDRSEVIATIEAAGVPTE